MRNAGPRIVVTGLGVVTSIGHAVASFEDGLRRGSCGVGRLEEMPGVSVTVAARVRDFSWQSFFGGLEGPAAGPGARARKILASAPGGVRLSACVAVQAFLDARLHRVPVAPEEIGVVVAGSNLATGYTGEAWEKFRETGRVNPKYAIWALDSSQVGCVSEILGTRGFGFTVSGASGSGNVAVWNAVRVLRAGDARCVLVCGASADLGALDLEAYGLLGAALTDSFQDEPERASRPFDRRHGGFVWGEGAACLVLETAESARERGVRVLGEIAGTSLVLDGTHLPSPSGDGEARAMRKALEEAGASPSDVGYVNAHGSSSPVGDACECAALKAVFGPARPWVNSTKSLTGHCLNAAGLVELVACVLQLGHGFLHPNLNLEEPVDPLLRFVGSRAEEVEVAWALSNSFGFGGVNSSVLLHRLQSEEY